MRARVVGAGILFVLVASVVALGPGVSAQSDKLGEERMPVEDSVLVESVLPPGANAVTVGTAGTGDLAVPVDVGEASLFDERALAEAARGGLVPVVAELGGGEPAVVDGFGRVPVSVEVSGEGVAALVEVLPSHLTERLSSLDAAVALEFVDDGNGSKVPVGPVEVSFDLADVVLVDAASLWERLILVWLTDCHVSSDGGRAACGGSQQLETVVDRAGRSLSALLDVDGLAKELEAHRDLLVDSGAKPSEVFADVAAVVNRVPVVQDEQGELSPMAVGRVAPVSAVGVAGSSGAGGFSMLSVSSSAAGASGDFSASEFTTLADFQVGLFTGAAEVTYPIEVPAPAAGPAPYVGLSYSSAVIDGMNTSTSNQGGVVGLGWSLQVGGSVTEHFESCATYGSGYPAAQSEMCPNLNSSSSGLQRYFSLSLDGRSSRLVHESGNLYRLQSDPMWRIELKTSGSVSNADSGDEYWLVTTTDGTQYRFGWNADAADYRPVYYPSGSGWPAATCTSSTRLCDEVYQWHLDEVTDTSGNEVRFVWRQEFNHYDGLGSPSYKQDYVMASAPSEIWYTEGTQSANARIVFNYQHRCNRSDIADCLYPNHYPDTPSDLWCDDEQACTQATPAATFWTQLRLQSIQTQIYQSGSGSNPSFHTIRTYDLTQVWGTPPDDSDGDPSEPKMVLQNIAIRPGNATGEAGYEDWGFSTIEAETAEARGGVGPFTSEAVSGVAADVGGGEWLGWFDRVDDYAHFDDVYLGGGTPAPATKVYLRVLATGTSTLELRRGSSSGPVLGSYTFSQSSNPNWQTISIPVTNIGVTRVDDIVVTMTARSLGANVKLNWLRFSPSSTLAIPHLPNTSFWPFPSQYDSLEYLDNRVNHGPGVSAMTMPRMKYMVNPLGGWTEFTYGQSHPCATNTVYNYTNHALDCFPGWDPTGSQPGWVAWEKWKVTQVDHYDDFSATISGLQGPGNPTRTTTYEYSAPGWGFNHDPIPNNGDKTWSDFRGHGTVTVTRKDGSTILGRDEYTYFRGLHGDPSNYSGGTKTVKVDLHDTTIGSGTQQTYPVAGGTTYDEYQFRGQLVQTRFLPAAGNVEWEHAITKPKRTATAGSGLDGAYWTAPLDQLSWTLTDSSYVEHRTRYETYDAYANPIQINSYSDGATSNDNTVTRFQYINDTTNWLIGLPKHINTWAGDTSGTVYTSLRRNVMYYDGQGHGASTGIGLLTKVLDYPDNSTATFISNVTSYDSKGRPESGIDGNGNSIGTTTYDATHGYVTAQKNALNHSMTYVPDNLARRHKVTDANGHVTEAAYDSYGRVIKTWAPGHASSATPTTEYVYVDAWPAVLQTNTRTTGASMSSSYAYFDGFGNVFQSDVVSPANQSIRTITGSLRDAAGRSWKTSAPFQASGSAGSGYVVIDWNSQINWDEISYSTGSRTTTRAHKTFTSAMWTSATANDGLKTVTTDPNGNQITNEINTQGNLVKVTEHDNPTPGADAVTAYGYDRLQRLTSVFDDAGNTTTIGYDDLGRKLSLIDPDTGTWAYGYDNNSNLVSQDGPRTNDDLWLAYDDLNRNTDTRRTNSSGSLLGRLSYDTSGRKGLLYQARASNNGSWNGTWTYTYDDRNRVTDQNLHIPDQNGVQSRAGIDFSYTSGGMLESVSYPLNLANYGTGETVTYGYDPVTGVLLTADSDTSGFELQAATYDFAGRNLTRTYDNASSSDDYVSSRIYQQSTGRLAESRGGKETNTVVYQYHTYTYDNAGNVTALLDVRNPQSWHPFQQQCFDYDNQHRLTRAYTRTFSSGPWCTGTPSASDSNGSADAGTAFDRRYTYDTIGNLKSLEEAYNDPTTTGDDRFIRTYTYGAGTAGPHAVTSINDTAGPNMAFGYDPAGNMTTRNIGVGTDALTYHAEGQLATHTQAGVVSTMRYDTNGIRIRQQVGTTDTLYAGQWWEKTGTDITNHYIIDGETVAFAVNGNVDHIFTDQIGSISSTDGASGYDKNRYHPFGSPRDNLQVTATDRGYTGQRRDNTGLMYYQSRYYDPLIGRFTQPDTIIPNPANGQDFNRYTYVGNNPINANDPTGHETCTVDGNNNPTQNCWSESENIPGRSDAGFSRDPSGTLHAWHTNVPFAGIEGPNDRRGPLPAGDTYDRVAFQFGFDGDLLRALDGKETRGFLEWASMRLRYRFRDAFSYGPFNISQGVADEVWAGHGPEIEGYFALFDPLGADAAAGWAMAAEDVQLSAVVAGFHLQDLTDLWGGKMSGVTLATDVTPLEAALLNYRSSPRSVAGFVFGGVDDNGVLASDLDFWRGIGGGG